MEKTIQHPQNQRKSTPRKDLILGGAILAVLAVSLLGIQSVYGAINTQLDRGDRGFEVTKLQTYLSTNATIYPERLVTGYYGQLTKAAVERFQTAEGIVSSGTPVSTGYGRVGPITRAAINAKLAGGGTPSPTPTGDVYAPTITSVNIQAMSNNATITWTASEAAMGKVYYSTSPIRMTNVFDATGVFSGEPVITNGTLAGYDGVARVTHSVSLNNLAPNTTYFYLVVAFDSAKNVSITTPASFSTTQ